MRFVLISEDRVPPVVALLTGGVGWGMLPFLKLVDMVGGRCYGSDLEDVVGSFVAKPVCCEALGPSF